MLPDYEKLGVFYLGREFDLATKKRNDSANILYDSKDLVTHAVCVGMTGSGKTGLCLALLEEAAMDGIPAIVIDPKGDIGNLLLTFPQLTGEVLRPWVNESDARTKGVDVDTFAQQQADLWKSGLAKWDQDEARIGRLRQQAEFAIYTPGSSAGLPVSILKSFDAPDETTREDMELFRERINTTVTSLLGLLNIDADPIQSREHILLSNIFAKHWGDGESLDLGRLIGEIQKPPMERIGVLDLESFYPQKERFGLAMQLNNLLASPGFSAWTDGAPLDVQSLLYSPAGKPRIAIFNIAHLGDSERMFFVSLLLNQMLGWMRAQNGTTSLRALLYMDEIFGYFPPTANPPSKQPLLTLLKQARAFGLGVVLATQNPVDLDYKGLSNCGTWFIGRLQTERDKMRVLEGLEGAAAGASQSFDRGRMEQTLAGLGNRVFLMNNVHEDAPVIFESRWAMSYLRGPLGRAEIKLLMDPIKKTQSAPAPEGGRAASAARSSAAPSTSTTSARPMLPPEIKQYFIPARGALPQGATLLYHPYLLGTADVNFMDRKAGVNEKQVHALLAAITDEPVPVEWANAEECKIPEDTLDDAPAAGASFGDVPSAAAAKKNYDAWTKSLVDHLYRNAVVDLFVCDEAAMNSKPGESERDFRARIAMSFREERDATIEKLRAKYGPKTAMLQDRLRRAEQRRAKEAAEASSSKWTAAISVGASLLGALMGRKTISVANATRIGTAARTIGSTKKQSDDVARADEDVEAVQQQLTDLDAQLQEEIAEATAKFDATCAELSTLTVHPKKTDVTPRLIALAWVPNWQDATGRLTPAWA